jgi:hypothetical protein
VLRAQADLVERALEVARASRARGCRCRRARCRRPRRAPRRCSAGTPATAAAGAGARRREHALAPSHLPRRCGLRHRPDASVRPMATRASAPAAEVAQDYFGLDPAGDTRPSSGRTPTTRTRRSRSCSRTRRQGRDRGLLRGLYGAFPTSACEIVDLFGEGDRAVCHWRVTGDLRRARAFNGSRRPARGSTSAASTRPRARRADRAQRRLHGHRTSRGSSACCPAAGSPAEQRMTQRVQPRTRSSPRARAAPEEIADGRLVVRGGFPARR